MTNAYRILIEKSAGKRTLKRLKCRCEDNIKLDPKEIGRRMWRGLVGPVTGCCEHDIGPLSFVFWAIERHWASQEGVCPLSTFSQSVSCVVSRSFSGQSVCVCDELYVGRFSVLVGLCSVRRTVPGRRAAHSGADRPHQEAGWTQPWAPHPRHLRQR